MSRSLHWRTQQASRARLCCVPLPVMKLRCTLFAALSSALRPSL
jgi:hypothetical protein